MAEIFIEPDQLASADALAALGLAHNPITALLVPRPIAWISTVSAAGVANLSPFSFCGMVSQAPPMLMFCANASHGEGGDKDTLRNVRETGEFVFNLATWDLRNEMNASSAMIARASDEFEHAGLEKSSCRFVKASRVARSPIALECVVVSIVDLPPDERSGQRNTATIGRVIGIHVDSGLVRDGIIDVMQSQPLARLGYLDYATCTDIFTMPRPSS